jgi:hypothetical protein
MSVAAEPGTRRIDRSPAARKTRRAASRKAAKNAARRAHARKLGRPLTEFEKAEIAMADAHEAAGSETDRPESIRAILGRLKAKGIG